MDNPTCVVCGKQITWRFYLCEDCSQEYGHLQSDRPEWVKYLVREEMRERKRSERGYYPPTIDRDITELSDAELYKHGLWYTIEDQLDEE